MTARRNFGDPGPKLMAWRAVGLSLTVLMLGSIGLVLWGVTAIGGDGGAMPWLAAILGVAAAAGFGWLAAKAGERVDFLEGGLVRHAPKRLAIVAGAVVLLGIVAMLWFWVFPWVDRTFVNRPAVGG